MNMSRSTRLEVEAANPIQHGSKATRYGDGDMGCAGMLANPRAAQYLGRAIPCCVQEFPR